MMDKKYSVGWSYAKDGWCVYSRDGAVNGIKEAGPYRHRHDAIEEMDRIKNASVDTGSQEA